MLGVSTSLARLAADSDLPPLGFLACSLAGAAVLSLGRAVARGTLPPLNLRTAEYFLCSALFTVAAPNLILAAAVVHVGAAFVATTIALPALLTYAGAIALGLERFRLMRVAGVALALAGTASMALLEIRLPSAAGGWVALTLLAPVLFACGNLYRTLRWPAGLAPEALTPGMLAAAALMLFAAAPVPLPALSIAWPPAWFVPLALVGAQTLVFAVQFRCLFELQRRSGPVCLSLIGPVGSLIGIPLAVTLLGESAPRGLAAGAVSIAFGVALLTFGREEVTVPRRRRSPTRRFTRRGFRRRRVRHAATPLDDVVG